MKKFFALFSLVLLAMSAWAANTYVKVTSLDQLETNKNYILVCEEYSRALGVITGTSTNYGSAVDITINDGVIDIEGTDVVELFSGQGSSDALGHATWTFNMAEGGHYMCWTSGNSLNTVNTSATNNAMWIATLTDDGVVLSNKVDNTRKLQYNSGAPRFACYTTNQKAAVLYVQGEPVEEGITFLSQANALADDESFTFNGEAVITVCKNGYVFLRDESDYGMIAGVEGAAYLNGQVLNQGWNATKTSVDGWVRYIDAANLSATEVSNNALAAAQKLTSFPDESMVNAYVYVENVPFGFVAPRAYPLPDGGTIERTEVLWGVNSPFSMITKYYNVYGVICKVDGTLKLCPVEFELYVEPQPTVDRGNVNGVGGVDMDDLTALINYLLDPNSTINYDNAAVCNSMDSTVVDMDDLTALINYLLTGTWD